jgi:hypothetical protein
MTLDTVERVARAYAQGPHVLSEIGHDDVRLLMAEYDRRGERLKTLELGLLAALMPGLDGPTQDRLGRKMRELVGLDENRQPILPPCPHGNDLASECTDGCRP